MSALARPFNLFWAAWREREALGDSKRSKIEREFLPAALEIQDSPPSPASRILLWSLLILFVTGIAWASVGKVDIVATATGKIIPVGKSKIIQPFEIGVVKAIYVSDGQTVKAGDPLIDLDPTTTAADEVRLQHEIHVIEAQLARTDALLNAIDQDQKPDNLFQAPGHVPEAVLTVQKNLMRSQYDEYQRKHMALQAESRKAKASLGGIREEIKKLEATVPLISQRVASLKSMSDKKLVAKNQYLELEQDRVEQVQDLAIARRRQSEIQQSIKAVEAQMQVHEAEFRKTIIAEKAEISAQLTALQQEYTKAKTRTGLQQLRSPVDGVVQQLAVHTIGGVVTPAQELMLIVPEEEQLEAEVWIENKDIGFINPGQQAEVKVDAFPFTKYGIIDAEVQTVSNDAVENEKLGWVFTSRVQLKKNNIRVENKPIRLTPGMSVSAEIKTGQRKLIEYFLAPLLRYRQESVRER